MGIYKKATALGRKAVKAVKKRYQAKPGGRKSTGGVRVAKMARDIMYLKSVLNPEKKRFLINQQDLPLAQVNTNGDGGFFVDCTPIMGQGVTNSTRNGASIKLHSSMWHFQFTQATNTISRIRGCIEIFSIKGEPYAPASFVFRDERYLVNNFTGGLIRDINSQLDPDNYMKGKLVARRYFSLAPDQLTGAKSICDVKIPIKYNKGQGHHIRFEANSNTLQSGQLYCVIRVDRGNMATSPSSLSVPDIGPETGLRFSYNRQDFFYDN